MYTGDPDPETPDKTHTSPEDSSFHSQKESPVLNNSNDVNHNTGKANDAYELPDDMEISKL